MLPVIFSAMEALLVPEVSGLKAGAVTVRSVAVHVALDELFFEPINIVEGYLCRSDLVPRRGHVAVDRAKNVTGRARRTRGTPVSGTPAR